MYTGFGGETKGKDPGVDGSDNIKMDLQEVGWWAWTGSIWLSIGTGGGLL